MWSGRQGDGSHEKCLYITMYNQSHHQIFHQKYLGNCNFSYLNERIDLVVELFIWHN